MVTSAVTSPPTSPIRMKTWGTGLFHDESGRRHQDEQGDARLVDRALQGHRLFPYARVTPRNVLSLSAGLPVLNIGATSKARL
jgi:hypothetical protein